MVIFHSYVSLPEGINNKSSIAAVQDPDHRQRFEPRLEGLGLPCQRDGH